MAALSSAAPKPLARCLSTVEHGGSEDLVAFTNTFKPLTEKTAEGRRALKAAWSKADPNGNKLCSLAELDSFVENMLQSTHGTDRGSALYKLFRPSIINAFNDAKDYKKDDGKVIPGTAAATQDDFVSPEEFRLFCAYAVIYAAMYDGFSTIDGGSAGREGDDRRIDLDEWLAGYENLAGYGFVAFLDIKNDESATAAFNAMDQNQGGFVLLDEYCKFVKEAEIENGTALGAMLAADQ